MKSGRHVARLLTAALVAATAGFIVTGGQSARAADPTLGSGGEFHPLTPARIFDSRPATAINDVTPPGAKPFSAPEPATFDIKVLGQGNIPSDPADVLAVVVNITVTEPTADGYLEAYGKGARPAARTSIVNFVANQTIPNVAIVRPGADGALTIGLFSSSTGTAQVVVDVFGWFSTSNYVAPTQIADDGSRLIPITPSRVLDTRDGTGQNGVIAPVGPKQTIELQIRGVSGVNPVRTNVVPNTPDVTGVLLNVVGITQRTGGASTYLSLLPDTPAPGSNPTTSNLNMPPGVIKANLVFVPVGSADGKVRIFNFQGQTDVVADVVGYLQSGYADTLRQGRVVPLSSPYRTFDTREPQWGGVALGPGQAEDWSFADFAGSVAIGPDLVGKQLGVIGNLTSAKLSRQYASVGVASFLTAYPSDAPERPLSSNLNMVEGPPVPNMAVLTYGVNNTVRVYNLAGYDHYLFDASAVILAD